MKGLVGAGAAFVVVLGGVATASLVGGQDTDASPDTVATVPAAVVTTAPVLPSPVMTLPGATAPPSPTSQPSAQVPIPKPTKRPEPVDGKFKVVRTVAKSNQVSVQVGAKETYTWTIPVLCDPYCTAIDPGGDVTVKGRTWTYSYASFFTCYRTSSTGKQYAKKKGTTTNKVALKFGNPGKGKPQTFTGTIKERLKKQCRGYEGEFKPWSVDYKLKGTFTGKKT